MSKIVRSSSGSKSGGIIVILILILLLIAAVFFGVAFVNANSDNILKGVTINDTLDLSNKSAEEASALFAEYQEKLDEKPFVLRFDNKTNTFKGKDIGLSVSKTALNDAYTIGKSDNIFENGVVAFKSLFGNKINIDADITFDEVALKSKVDDLISTTDATAVASTYEIKDDTIEIVKGHDGVVAEYDTLIDDVKLAIQDIESPVDVEVKAKIDRAKEVDIEALYKEVYKETKNAEVTSDGKYIQEQIGVSFDKVSVANEYRALQKDGRMTIRLTKTQPEVTTKNLENVWFADVLATTKTNYNAANLNRSNNLQRAAENITNRILLPGEEFSYNKEVGERTVARGFKEAHVYSGGEVVDGMGGGICQISSTLYGSVLKADLEVTERKNHMFYPEYVEPGLDATVAWGSIDFKFKNNRSTPIKLVVSAKGGVATATIYGKKEKDEPTITLQSVKLETYQPSTKTVQDSTMLEGTSKVTQSPVLGYKAEAYKVYKNANGKEIKKVKVSTDTYRATNKIVTVGTKKAPVTTTPVVETTPTPTTVEPTTPTPTTPTPTTTPSTNWPTGWDTPENPYYN